MKPSPDLDPGVSTIAASEIEHVFRAEYGRAVAVLVRVFGQIQAAINAVHSDAATAADTDWGQILALYDQLIPLAPTPVVALNRAVALAEVKGPAPGLAAVDQLDLAGYHLFHATRADLLTRLGRHADAADAYDAALALATNAAEAAFLDSRKTAARARATGRARAENPE